jgi:APA family basic amino acid/polyamine antiporter
MSSKRAQLTRQIGLMSAMVLVVANMVGSGVFTTSGFILTELGSPEALMWCWVLGGAFALTGALCYGELGAMFPHAGGEYAYLYRAFGPFPAFLSGWISLIVGFSAPIAAAAIAFATYFLGGSDAVWFEFAPGGFTLVRLSPVTLLACVSVVVISLIHMHSVMLGKRVQNGLTLFKIVFILVFIGAGFALGDGSFAHLGQTMESEGWSASGFAVSLIFVSFAYSGWNAAAYLGSEITYPERNLPLALVGGTLLVTGLYLLLNLVFIYALPPEAMSGTLEVGLSAATALFGSGVGALFALAIAIGLLSVLSAMIMAGPRVYYAMARDNLFFQRCALVHGTRHTPVGSILFQACIAILIILSTAYDTLLIYVGFTLSLCAMATVMGLMRLRRLAPQMQRPYRTFGYPLVPWIFILGNLWIMLYTIHSRPLVGLAGLMTIGIGVLLYGFIRPQRTHGDETVKNESYHHV